MLTQGTEHVRKYTQKYAKLTYSLILAYFTQRTEEEMSMVQERVISLT